MWSFSLVDLAFTLSYSEPKKYCTQSPTSIRGLTTKEYLIFPHFYKLCILLSNQQFLTWLCMYFVSAKNQYSGTFFPYVHFFRTWPYLRNLYIFVINRNCDKADKHQINHFWPYELQRRLSLSSFSLQERQKHEFPSASQSHSFWCWQDRFWSDYVHGLDRIRIYRLSICHFYCTTCTLWKICPKFSKIPEL